MSNAVLTKLVEERAGLVEYVDTTMAHAADEGRDLVPTELSTLQSTQERMAEIDKMIAPLKAFEDLRASSVQLDQKISPARREPVQTRQAFKGFGDLYLGSEEYQSRGAMARASFPEVQGSTLAMQTRAVLNTGVDPGKSFLPQPQQYTPASPALRTPLLDAVTRVPVTTGSVELLTWGEVTGFDTVAEGAEKPEVAVVNGSTNVPLETVAGFIQYTRQLAQDAPALRSLLDSGLTRGLLRELEEKLAQVITQATLPTTTGAAGQPMIEVIRAGIAKVYANGFAPDVLMASPATLAALDIYILGLGGSSSTVLGAGIWGLSPVPVVGMTETIVADGSAAFALFERTGIEIFTTDSDITGSGATAKSAFRQNILTTLAETRAKGAVLNPNAATECVTVAGP